MILRLPPFCYADSVPSDPSIRGSSMHRYLPLLALIAALAGCDKPAPTPASSGSDAVLPTPAEPAASVGHEMDPTKHVIPKTAAAGMIGGKPFAPDRVVFDNNRLLFRQGKDFFPDLEIGISFADYKATEALKLTVKPSQKWHEGNVPSLQVSQKTGDALPKDVIVQDGYALTLELAPRAKGQLSGSIFLSLPGAEKNFLAGTFTATYVRNLDDPPEPEDRPFIAGKLIHDGKADQSVLVRYVSLTAENVEQITDMVGSKLGREKFFAVRSTTFSPRVASLRPGKTGEEYDFARLPPGKYFLIARIDDGPAGWKLVDVAADSALDAPLTIPTAAGAAEVTVPEKANGQVQAIPVGLKLDDPTGTLTTRISGTLGAFDSVTQSKATLKNMAPGKYEVSLRSGVVLYRGEVEIEAGKVAKVELK